MTTFSSRIPDARIRAPVVDFVCIRKLPPEPTHRPELPVCLCVCSGLNFFWHFFIRSMAFGGFRAGGLTANGRTVWNTCTNARCIEL